METLWKAHVTIKPLPEPCQHPVNSKLSIYFSVAFHHLAFEETLSCLNCRPFNFVLRLYLSLVLWQWVADTIGLSQALNYNLGECLLGTIFFFFFFSEPPWLAVLCSHKINKLIKIPIPIHCFFPPFFCIESSYTIPLELLLPPKEIQRFSSLLW